MMYLENWGKMKPVFDFLCLKWLEIISTMSLRTFGTSCQPTEMIDTKNCILESEKQQRFRNGGGSGHDICFFLPASVIFRLQIIYLGQVVVSKTCSIYHYFSGRFQLCLIFSIVGIHSTKYLEIHLMWPNCHPVSTNRGTLVAFLEQKIHSHGRIQKLDSRRNRRGSLWRRMEKCAQSCWERTKMQILLRP